MKNVLIIDRNKKNCLDYTLFLENEGYALAIADNVEDGLHRIACEKPAVVLLEAVLPDMSTLAVLEKIQRAHRDVIVIVIGVDAETTIGAMRLGAFDVIQKPVDLAIVKRLLVRAFQMRAAYSALSPERADDPPITHDGPQLVGKSSQMHEIYKLIGIMASNTMTVLIEGETGTGKDVIARAIHTSSKRKEKLFVPVDCGALPDGLLESELFGYDAGAFTGAKTEGKPGRFELADGGTLFLDEIGNMTPVLQTKLLRALQTQEIERLGGIERLKVDVRVIAATNQPLSDLVKQGLFREDLYYRLKRITIQAPPLRERQEDIPLLIKHFLRLTGTELGKPICGISPEATELLQNHTWPGNVRELENCVRSAATLCRAGVILLEDLPAEIQTGCSVSPTDSLQLESPLILEDLPAEIQTGCSVSPTDSLQLESPLINETLDASYKNLFDLPVPVLCRFIAQNANVTMDQITDWSVALSNGIRGNANKAKLEIDSWRMQWATDQLTYPDLLQRIKDVVEGAIPQLSSLFQGSIDSDPIEDANPVNVEGKTFYESLGAVLTELKKEYRDDRKKLAKTLGLSLKQFEVELRKTQQLKKKGVSETGETDLSTPSEKKLKQFPEEEVKRFLTDPVRSYIGYSITGNEWRAKEAAEKIRTIRLALEVLAKRLQGHHGYICFGGMTFEQIREDIYRRATYLYATESEVAKALNVDLRTFRKYSPHQDGNFPEHYTLF